MRRTMPSFHGVDQLLEETEALLNPERDTLPCIQIPAHQFSEGDEVTLSCDLFVDLGNGYKTYTAGSVRGFVKAIIGPGCRIAFPEIPRCQSRREQWIHNRNLMAVPSEEIDSLAQISAPASEYTSSLLAQQWERRLGAEPFLLLKRKAS